MPKFLNTVYDNLVENRKSKIETQLINKEEELIAGGCPDNFIKILSRIHTSLGIMVDREVYTIPSYFWIVEEEVLEIHFWDYSVFLWIAELTEEECKDVDIPIDDEKIIEVDVAYRFRSTDPPTFFEFYSYKNGVEKAIVFLFELFNYLRTVDDIDYEKNHMFKVYDMLKERV